MQLNVFNRYIFKIKHNIKNEIFSENIYTFRYSVNTRAEALNGGDEGSIVSTLSITIRSADEGGRYGCNATNTGGSHAHHARLNVFGKYSYIKELRVFQWRLI